MSKRATAILLLVTWAACLLPGYAQNSRDISTENGLQNMFTTDDPIMKTYTFTSTVEEIVTLRATITFTTDYTFVLLSEAILSITSEDSEYNSLVRAIGDTGPLFEVSGSASLSLTNVVIVSTATRNGGAISVLSSSGVFIASGVTFSGCNSTGFGGAVYNRGVATFSDSTFTRGYANVSGALFNAATGVTTVTGGAFTDCHSTQDGGAFSNGGTMTIAGTAFSMNRAAENGGDGANVGGLLTIQSCQLSDASATAINSNGGSLFVSAGVVTLADTVISRSASGTKGGGVGITGGAVVVENLVIEDAYTGLASQGTGVFVSGAALNGSGLVFNSSAVPRASLNTSAEKLLWGEFSGAGRVKAQEGGGLYVGDQAAVKVSNLTCDNLAAQLGACIFVFKGSLAVEGGVIQNNYGASTVDGGTATVFVKDQAVVSFSNTLFSANTLNPLNVAQKGAAIYALNAYLTLHACTFQNHSVVGQGGSIMIESESTLTATNLVVRDSRATTLGGFLLASSSSVSIDGLDARGCSCVSEEDVQSSGGVLYGSALKFMVVRNAKFVGNKAFSGGAIYVDKVKACAVTSSNDCPTTTQAEYLGLQVFDSSFEGNVAALNSNGNHGNGGAIAAKQSIGYFNNVQFKNNEALGGKGSALDFASDVVFQLVSLETTKETSATGSLLESTRVALDNTSLVSNMGLGIQLLQDVSATDARSQLDGDEAGTPTYPIMNRNSDLSSVSVEDASGLDLLGISWGYMPCLDNKNAPEFWYPSIELPGYASLGATFFPVCPPSATCEDSDATRGIQCTCPPDSHYANVVNSEMSCDTATDTPKPTPFPTVPRLPAVGPPPNVTFTVADNDLVLGVSLFDGDLPLDVFLAQLACTVALGVLLLMTLLVNCGLHEGPPRDVLDDRVFWVMSKAPGLFHLAMCVKRQPFVDALKEIPDHEIEPGAAARKAKSLSLSSENLGQKKGKRHKGKGKRKTGMKHLGHDGDLFHRLESDIDYNGEGGTSPLLKKGTLENMSYPGSKQQQQGGSEAGGGGGGGCGGRLAGRLEETKEERSAKKTKKKGSLPEATL